MSRHVRAAEMPDRDENVDSSGGSFRRDESCPMKSFVRPSFFRVFDLLLSTSNPGLKRSRWTFDGVEFERERHTFSGPNHGLAVDIVTLTRPGRRGWKLMVTKEYWWAGTENEPLKNLHWARPAAGQRNDILTRPGGSARSFTAEISDYGHR